jgi:hypothetical protein
VAAGLWLSAGGLFHPFRIAGQPVLAFSSRIGFLSDMFIQMLDAALEFSIDVRARERVPMVMDK